MLKSGFDLIAPLYDSLANLVFGRAIRQSQTVFLSHLPNQARILIIGGGTGWILTELFSQNLPQRIVYLEASGKMLKLARLKIKSPEQAACLEFRLGTEKDIKPEEEFDVIISHFFLDLFLPNQLKNITGILFKCLRPGGLWLIADFVSTPGYNIRYIFNRLLIKCIYAFFRIISRITAGALPDWESYLTAYGLVPQKSIYFYHSLIKSVLLRKN